VRHLFLNGPVQNGPFTFADRPGKAVGIRLAAALNGILGMPPAPDLWNTVTLAGDLRYRQTNNTALSRQRFETNLIDRKYGSSQAARGGIMTDADPEVADLALEMVEHNLRTGALTISRETVVTCRGCGHMTGYGGHPCNSCGSTDLRDRTGLHLVARPAMDRPVLDRSDIHASHRQQSKHLQQSAGNVDRPLIISRTRDHGIQLAPLGLGSLVLDPRVGVHATVLAAAQRHRACLAVMTITQNAANHIAAHGQHFREHDGIKLKYALHGHLPLDDLASLQPVHTAYRVTQEIKDNFEQWFLPLFSLRAKAATKPNQLTALFKHYMRAYLAQPGEADEAVMNDVQGRVSIGDTDWITNKRSLANVIAARTTSPLRTGA
jgi:hypothetical protein